LSVTDLIGPAVRLLLAAVLVVAGVAKLGNRQETIQVLRDFGAPRPIQPFGVLLPPLEIALAVGLLFARSAWYAAAGTLALLTLFIAGIAANLARGRQPACNCFGQLHSRPISWRTLVRNAGAGGGRGVDRHQRTAAGGRRSVGLFQPIGQPRTQSRDGGRGGDRVSDPPCAEARRTRGGADVRRQRARFPTAVADVGDPGDPGPRRGRKRTVLRPR